MKVDEREPIWEQQRKERGFDDRELWNLDHTIANFVLPRLKEFKRCSCGRPNQLTNKEWKAILSKMIWSFESKVNDEQFAPNELTNEQKDLWYKRKNEGFKLFGKWFNDLWI